jgi:hypothetical protein
MVLFWTTFKLKFLGKFLTVPKTLALKKTMGQYLSIGPRLDQIGLTNAEK